MRKSAFVARMETLERRDTPSRFGGVPEGLPHRFARIAGSGTGVVMNPTVGDTSLTVPFTVQGNGTAGPIRGSFTGGGIGNLTPNQPAIGSAVLTLSNGDQVDVRLHGKLQSSPRQPRMATANLGFKLVNVGPTFSGAAGSGTLTGTLDTTTGTFRFTYRGSIRY